MSKIKTITVIKYLNLSLKSTKIHSAFLFNCFQLDLNRNSHYITFKYLILSKFLNILMIFAFLNLCPFY